jgi:hypothetical protein
MFPARRTACGLPDKSVDFTRQDHPGIFELTRWVAEGELKAYSRAGDRKRYVDLEDIRKLQQLRPIDQ